MGYTLFFEDSGQHPSCSLSALANMILPPAKDSTEVAQRMVHLTGDVRALLSDGQALHNF